MKTKILSAKITTILLSVSLITVSNLSSYSQTSQPVYAISGNANGAQVVPAVNGGGAGTITGTYDPSTHVLNYTTNWNNLTGAPSTAGFYSGASGENGKAIGDPWAFGTNVSGTGNTTGKVTLTDEQANQLIAGNWYYTYSTSTNANGEIRGQITAKK